MIEIKNLSARRGSFSIKDISLSIPEGGLTCIMGENGSGKTTLLRCLAGLIKYTGSIIIDGRDAKALPPAARARLIALLPQHLPDSRLTLAEFMRLSRIPWTGVWGHMSEADKSAIQRALEALGLEAFCERRLDTLSGGELRRAAIAATLAQDTPYVLLDEPAGNLDPRAARELRTLTRRMVTEFHRTAVMVTHDIADAEAADRINVMRAGSLFFDGTYEACRNERVMERVFFE